jgi:hypothetical protein
MFMDRPLLSLLRKGMADGTFVLMKVSSGVLTAERANGILAPSSTLRRHFLLLNLVVRSNPAVRSLAGEIFAESWRIWEAWFGAICGCGTATAETRRVTRDTVVTMEMAKRNYHGCYFYPYG